VLSFHDDLEMLPRPISILLSIPVFSF